MQENQYFLGVNCSRTGIRIGVAKRDGILKDMVDYPLKSHTGGAVFHCLREAIISYCQQKISRRWGSDCRAISIPLKGHGCAVWTWG